MSPLSGPTLGGRSPKEAPEGRSACAPNWDAVEGPAPLAGVQDHAAAAASASDRALRKRAGAHAGQLSIHANKPPTLESDHDYAPVCTRLRRYGPAHQRALDMAAYLRTIDTDEGRNDGKTRTHYADDLERCGRWLEFESYAHREASLLVSAYFCDRYRLCPFCAMRRCARSLQDNAPKIRHALTETVEHTPDAYLGLLTLTVKNGPDLAERFAHLMDSWRTMIRRRRHYLEWKNGRGRPRKWSFGAAFSGGAYSVEIKRGCGTRGGNWHPHLHAAVLVTEPVTRQQISDEWKEITDDSHIVDLRPFHSFQESTNPTDEDIASDLIEVLKYPLKFETVSLSDNWHAELVLAGKRLRDTFGSFRGVKLEPAELTDYAEDFAGEPFVRIAAEWIDDRYIVREGLRYEG